MITARRFVKDESGMTLALAVIMIVLIGVMGAGLLTFVMKDLNTVVEENRGQRAFEVAEAGIGAAKRQLASSVVRTDYDGVSPDIQWSKAQGGLRLNDLDGDGKYGGRTTALGAPLEAELPVACGELDRMDNTPR